MSVPHAAVEGDRLNLRIRVLKKIARLLRGPVDEEIVPE